MRQKVLAFFLATLPLLHAQDLTAPSSHWAKAQKLAAEGFQPIDCFAGQLSVRGKHVKEQPFSVLKADERGVCCGALIRSSKTDQHGMFFVESLAEGRYYVRFNSRGTEYVTRFAVVESYQKCGNSHVELDFLNPSEAKIQQFVDIHD